MGIPVIIIKIPLSLTLPLCGVRSLCADTSPSPHSRPQCGMGACGIACSAGVLHSSPGLMKATAA